MRILGLDPGTAITGFGVIEYGPGGRFTFVDAGVITTPATDPMPRRLATLYAELTEVVRAAQPDQAAVEQLFFATNVTTAISVGQARGVILLVLAQAGLTPAEYTPMQIKQAVTGYGGAKKPQVQEMVGRLLDMTKIPQDDAADALAAAITHAGRGLS